MSEFETENRLAIHRHYKALVEQQLLKVSAGQFARKLQRTRLELASRIVATIKRM